MAETGNIEGIDAITYSTDRWDDARRFFADWGLKLLVDDPVQQVWETLNGAQVVVRRPDDASLPAPIEAGPTMREVTWGVVGARRLDEIAQALKVAFGTVAVFTGGVPTASAATFDDVCPSGFVIVRSCDVPAVAPTVEMLTVTCVASLKVTLLTATPLPLNEAAIRHAPEPGSQNPVPVTDVPVTVTSTEV